MGKFEVYSGTPKNKGSSQYIGWITAETPEEALVSAKRHFKGKFKVYDTKSEKDGITVNRKRDAVYVESAGDASTVEEGRYCR